MYVFSSTLLSRLDDFIAVFTAAEELWERFGIAKGFPCVVFHGHFTQFLQLQEHGWSLFIYIIRATEV